MLNVSLDADALRPVIEAWDVSDIDAQIAADCPSIRQVGRVS